MTVSPNGRLIALFGETGKIGVFSTDFTVIPTPPARVLQCACALSFLDDLYDDFLRTLSGSVAPCIRHGYWSYQEEHLLPRHAVNIH